MVVLGADPDAPVTEWKEFEPRPFFNPRTAGLVHHFGYHPGMGMNQRFNDFDKKILSGHFSLMLKRGYSHTDLKEMIDRFWQSWGADYDTPATAFVSKAMQEKLTADVEVKTNDAVMDWMLAGMPDDGPLDDCSSMRNAVLQCSDDLTHRYPDVVAEILRLNKGYHLTRRLLLQAQELIRWNMRDGGDDFDVYEALDDLQRITLPPELRTSVPTPSKIREKRARMSQAVAQVPIRRKKRERAD